MAATAAQTTALDIRIERDVAVPMPDGTILRADLWRPGNAGPVPALLQRTPYDKSFALVVQGGLDPARAVAAGYAVVVQDVRGRFASEGEWHPFEHERADGAATVAWVAAQPWCDGRVAMYGGSYVGLTQLLAAGAAPPALTALLPHVTAADPHDDWFFTNGAFQLGLALNWARNVAAAEAHRREDRGEDVAALIEDLDAELADPMRGFAHLPLGDQPALAELLPEYLQWLTRARDDALWRRASARDHLDAVGVPALHLAGWHDVFLDGSLAVYERLAALGRAPQKLVVGPWAHSGWGDAVGEVIYGAQASRYALDTTELHLRWFDEVLRGRPMEREAPVRIFVMGANRWRDEDAWPLARARDRRLHLRAGGRLSWEPPAEGEPADTYNYDPADPVPTAGGRTLLPGHEASIALGPRDQRALHARPDVLVYLSEPLDRPLEVTGTVRIDLHATSSALDTDFTAKLIDVAPDRRALGVVDAIVRARHRDGDDAPPRLLEPGRPERYAFALGATSLVFGAGHRIGVEISSSNFPRFDRNPNTGADLASGHPRAFTVARQRVLHDAQHPSHLILPTVE